MRIKYQLQCILFLTLLFLAPPAIHAGSPWQWDFTLKQKVLGDAMHRPTGLYIDRKKQYYYVVDSGNNRILSFNSDGELLHILNAGKALKIPYSMTRTDDKGLWITEKGKNSLSYIDFQNKKVIPHILRNYGRVVYPDRVREKSGKLFVLDKRSGSIIEYSRKLAVKRTFACNDCSSGFVDFTFKGNTLWALDLMARSVYRFSADGRQKKIIRLGNQVTFPVSLAIGPSGFLYVLDRHRRDIAVYDKNGEFKYHFLRKGITRGRLYYPIALRFDPWGRLCVVDEGNARVEVYRR